MEARFKSRSRNCEFDAELEEETNSLKEEIKTSISEFQNEMFEVTELVQASVLGAHLFQYKFDRIGVNPCLNEKT